MRVKNVKTSQYSYFLRGYKIVDYYFTINQSLTQFLILSVCLGFLSIFLRKEEKPTFQSRDINPLNRPNCTWCIT